jgi:replicative DNA helicase
MSTQSLLDRVPPQDLEAEAAVLGSIVLDNECAGEIVQVITADAFYSRRHQLMYESMVALYDARRAIDMLTLRDELAKRGILDEIGGVQYLAEVVESVPSSANAVFYARIVRERALMRLLISSCTNIIRDAYEGRDDADEVLDRSEKAIFDIAESRIGADAEPLKEVIKKTFERLDRFHERRGGYTGIPCGFMDLDRLTAGFQNAEMIIVAARPSMGKTTFCLNIAQHVALEEKLPVAVFSLEMSQQMLAQNLLCMHARVDASRLRSGVLSGTHLDTLIRAAGTLSDAPIYIDDTPGMTILQLRAKARRLAARRGIKLMMVDYIQLMSAPGEESRQQEIAAISRGIKALARELDIPIIALSQLNRSPEAREGHKPRLGDLRESGALEQDADVVVLLHRPAYYTGGAADEGAQAPGEETEVIIAKQRNGPTDTVRLMFFKNLLRFESYAAGSGF